MITRSFDLYRTEYEAKLLTSGWWYSIQTVRIFGLGDLIQLVQTIDRSEKTRYWFEAAHIEKTGGNIYSGFKPFMST
ncbi:hypothetical protein FHS21_004937 [Phyllobacterium trifolii]|uniref:Uncharacterized protein n=1 Tax=Phyllobacterium trifolii TaxID=300193 RepID=A0A839UIX7_9HYPH|nr:hypothetical protein [Phyllobacterium trifolii]